MTDARAISDHWASGDVYARIAEAMKAVISSDGNGGKTNILVGSP